MALKGKTALLHIMVLLGFGFGTLALGQDSNWDLRNYHLYNPYAFLSNRLEYDIAPAQLQTYYNPIFHIPYFWMVSSLPPLSTALLLGMLQGVNYFILFKIARGVIDSQTTRYRLAIPFFLALTGTLGAGNISELGTAMGDNIISLLILGSLFLVILCEKRMNSNSLRSGILIVAMAGFTAGIAGGLKLTSLIFSLALALGLLGLSTNLTNRLLLVVCFSTGVLFGVASAGGFWFYYLWERFGNPLFPYFNNYFKSPFASFESHRDGLFLPRGLKETAFYPLIFLRRPEKVAEVAFFDLRIPLLYLTSLLLIVKICAARLPVFARFTAFKDNGVERIILMTSIIAYIVWLKVFGIYRYIVVLEMLAPIVIWILISAVFSSQRVRLVSMLTICIVLIVTTRPMDWERTTWQERYFNVKVPELSDPKRTLTLMAGMAPLAYLVREFPPSVRFVRIQSNFHGAPRDSQILDNRIRHIILEHQGPLYALFHSDEEAIARRAFNDFSLAILGDDCRIIEIAEDSNDSWTTKFCGLKKTN